MYNEWSIYSSNGERKYLNRSEIERFIKEARGYDGSTYVFCWMMAATGCRISECLSIMASSIDRYDNNVVIECKKKRGKKVFRSIPIPEELVQKIMTLVEKGTLGSTNLWNWSRMTAYRKICDVMQSAGISGGFATPKGLRHGFAVAAIQANIPLNIVQRWLGHADIKTTAIYANAVGPEERQLAARMWRRQKNMPDRATEAAIGSQKEYGKSTISAREDGDLPFATEPLSGHSHMPDMNSIKGGCVMLQNWIDRNSTFPYVSYTYLSSPTDENILFRGDGKRIRATARDAADEVKSSERRRQ